MNTQQQALLNPNNYNQAIQIYLKRNVTNKEQIPVIIERYKEHIPTLLEKLNALFESGQKDISGLQEEEYDLLIMLSEGQPKGDMVVKIALQKELNFEITPLITHLTQVFKV